MDASYFPFLLLPIFLGKVENNEGKGTPKLKLNWKCKKEDESQGGYSKDVLLRLLQKYGEVLNLVISSKKAGTAVVEFATVKAAVSAVCVWLRNLCRAGTQFCGPLGFGDPHSLELSGLAQNEALLKSPSPSKCLGEPSHL